MKVTSGKMIFLVFASIFIGTSFCNVTKEIEVFCPNGWLAQGQVIYAKSINNNKNLNEFEYSLCLVCKQSTILKHPYDIIEVCVSKSKNLLEDIDMQCQSVNCQSKPNQSKYTWKLLDKCYKTLEYQPVCGMKINMTDKTLKEAMKNVDFVLCKKISYDQSFYTDKLYFSVDLVCPEGSIFESLKVRKAKFNNQDKSEAVCLICNLGLNSIEAKVSLCSAALCLSSKSIIRNLKFETEFQMTKCGETDPSCYQNITTMDKYCGYRYNKTELKRTRL